MPDTQPDLLRVRVGTLQTALSAIDRARSCRNQAATLRKKAPSESTYIVKVSVQVEESALSQTSIPLSESFGSITFIDVAAIEHSVGGIGNCDKSPMDSVSASHTHATLVESLQRQAKALPRHELCKGTVQGLVSDCFGQDGESFVILGVSSYDKDSEISRKTCMLGNSILKAL